MNIQRELLALKNLNLLQKLILGLILDTDPIVLLWSGGYDATCTEIGKELGMKRPPIRKEVDALIELGYITCKIGGWRRITNVTDKLKRLL